MLCSRPSESSLSSILFSSPVRNRIFLFRPFGWRCTERSVMIAKTVWLSHTRAFPAVWQRQMRDPTLRLLHARSSRWCQPTSLLHSTRTKCATTSVAGANDSSRRFFCFRPTAPGAQRTHTVFSAAAAADGLPPMPPLPPVPTTAPPLSALGARAKPFDMKVGEMRHGFSCKSIERIDDFSATMFQVFS